MKKTLMASVAAISLGLSMPAFAQDSGVVNPDAGAAIGAAEGVSEAAGAVTGTLVSASIRTGAVGAGASDGSPCASAGMLAAAKTRSVRYVFMCRISLTVNGSTTTTVPEPRGPALRGR